MTARERLDRNTRRATFFAFLGAALFLISLVGAAKVTLWMLALAPIGWLAVLIAV